MSTKSKLISVVSIVLLLAFTGIVLSNYIVARGNMRTGTLDEILPLIGNNISSDLQSCLMQPIGVSSMMAHDAFLKDWAMNGERDLAKIMKYLREIKHNYGYFTAFFVSDKTRKHYHYQGIQKTISPSDSHDAWYYSFKKQGEPLALDVDADETDNYTLTVFVNHRLNDSKGGFLGVVGVGLRMDRVSKTLLEYQRQYKRSVYLVDKKGLIRMHADSSLVEKQSISDPGWFGAKAGAVLNSKEANASFEIERQGEPVLLSVRYIKELNWFLIVEQQENQVLGGIRTAVYRNLAIGFLVTAFVILAVIGAINHYQGRLKVLATMDELTGVPNRRHFLELLDRELARCARFGQPVSLLVIDVDNFKAINDNHGHDAGDLALKLLSRALSECLRKMDFLGRIGGGEFGVFLPQTKLADAADVAERIRLAVLERHVSTSKGPLGLSVTIGVATARPGKVEREDLVRAADLALLEAKEAGRNQVASSGVLPPYPETQTQTEPDISL